MPTSLLLSVTRASWAVPADHGTQFNRNPRFQELRAKVLVRDKNVCQGCGWKSDQHQEIHHRDDDHENFAESNLETLCPLCHQAFHLPTVGLLESGELIWLPEMSQASLNLLCIGLFVAQRQTNGKHEGTAKSVFSALLSRKSVVDKHVGQGGVSTLAQVLLKYSPEEYAQRANYLSDLRLLPQASRFEQQIAHWATQFGDLPEADWAEVLGRVTDVAAPTTA